LGTTCPKFYLDLFRFDIIIVRCLGGYFFGHSVCLLTDRFALQWLSCCHQAVQSV